MDAKRVATLCFAAAFVLLTAVFGVFGGKLREYFSLSVTYTTFVQTEFDGRFYPLALPTKAIHTDDGGNYIWAVIEDDMYGEWRSALHRYSVEVLHESDGYTAVSISSYELYDAKIAVDISGTPEENGQVTVLGRAG